MKIVIIDGQGGRLGRLVVESIRAMGIREELLAVGTNAIATAAMLKAGADLGATGENPVVVAARDADVIIAPIGILSADAMFGEVTEKMAVAVGRCAAIKLLLPVSLCDKRVVGVPEMSMPELAREAARMLAEMIRT